MISVKSILPTSLFGRTLLIILIPVLLLQIAVSFVFFDRHWSRMTERLASGVVGEIHATLMAIQDNPDNFDDIRTMLKTYMAIDVNKMNSGGGKYLPIQMFDSNTDNKRFLGGKFQEGIEKDLALVIDQNIALPYTIDVIQNDKRVVIQFLDGDDLIYFAVPERRLFSSSSYIFILWMMALSVLLFTISMIFMRNQIRPIFRLGVIAQRLGRGIPVGVIKPSGAREVRQTAEAFIQMQKRIQDFIQQRTVMLAGVSHDLRTPLTRMKLQLEMLGDNPDTQAMRQDIADMEQMIEGYLSFAKGDGDEPMQRFDIVPVLQKSCEDGRRLSLDVSTNFNGIDTLFIWGKPNAIARVFDNIIGNATQYATRLSVTLKKDHDDSIHIIIDDNGPGMTAEECKHVIKPFVRGEVSRNKKTGGVGLGLTIVNDIVSSHGGELSLTRSDVMGGLRVSVRLLV